MSGMKTWRELADGLSGGDIRESLSYTLVAGVLAHGVALFNKLSWHDDLNHGFLLSQQKAVAVGRWLRAALGWAVSKVFGGKNLSLPLVYGAASLLLIALSAHVLIRLFDIRRKPLRVALCAMMAVFPVVTSTLGYMFTAPYYFLALLLAVLAAYIAAGRPRWDGFIAAALCLCGCLGLYQAYFPVGVSLMVICLILELAEGRHATFGRALLRGAWFLGVCACALALYYAVWKLAMGALGLAASDYQGVSAIGESGLSAYVKAIRRTYHRFFLSFARADEDLYPMRIAWAQWLVIGLSAASALALVVRRFRQDKLQGLLMAVLIAALPLCFNLIYVITASAPGAWVHTLMLYGQCMLYVFLIAALESLLGDGKRLAAAAYRLGVAALALMVCLNVYFANSCYMKAEVMLQQTISQLTVLVAKIKTTEGYRDDMPVCVAFKGRRDASNAKNEAFEDLLIMPFAELSPHHNRRNLEDYLKRWCGFEPVMVDPADFGHVEEIAAMPDYPDDGGVKIIDDTVVVKW